MQFLDTRPVTGKAFIIRLITAPFMPAHTFSCLAEETGPDAIKLELGREPPEDSILDLLNAWAKKHGYKFIRWEEWKNGAIRIRDWTVS